MNTIVALLKIISEKLTVSRYQSHHGSYPAPVSPTTSSPRQNGVLAGGPRWKEAPIVTIKVDQSSIDDHQART